MTEDNLLYYQGMSEPVSETPNSTAPKPREPINNAAEARAALIPHLLLKEGETMTSTHIDLDPQFSNYSGIDLTRVQTMGDKGSDISGFTITYRGQEGKDRILLLPPVSGYMYGEGTSEEVDKLAAEFITDPKAEKFNKPPDSTQAKERELTGNPLFRVLDKALHPRDSENPS